jgi:hypothetical protein
MNDMISGEKSPAQPEVEKKAGGKQRNGLNFPSVAFMGIAVFLVVLMIIVLGWKIVNLENKKARLDSERRLLERDKLAYAKVLEELPSLEDKRQNLSRELDELKGKVQSNQTVLASLKPKRMPLAPNWINPEPRTNRFRKRLPLREKIWPLSMEKFGQIGQYCRILNKILMNCRKKKRYSAQKETVSKTR